MSIIESWNDMAQEHGLPKVQVLTPKRKQRIKVCWEMLPDLDKWKLSIAQVPKDPFNLGENDRKWKANFDWFTNTKTPFLLLLENATVETPDKKLHGRFNTDAGYKKTVNGVDDDTASRLLGDILKGIL